MPTISYLGTRFELLPDESVLDCLLRHQQPIDYSCKSGVCQTCLVKSLDTMPLAMPPTSCQQGLKASLIVQGYALACQWQPQVDSVIETAGSEQLELPAKIIELSHLNHRVLRVRLTLNGNFSHFPGQYIIARNPNGVARNFSIANDFTQDGFLELHVQKVSGGQFSQWLFEQAELGEPLHIRGAMGDCFYLDDKPANPIVLAATGTGLAPLYGIINTALLNNHLGKIALYHCVKDVADLYYGNQLQQLMQQYPQFSYQPIVEPDINNAIKQIVQASPTAIEQCRFYLCGNPKFVKTMRTKVFLKGAKSSQIFSDAFLELKAKSTISL